jgi:hypothetical protein
MTKLINVDHTLLKEWSNSDGSYVIKAYADNIYEIIEDGVSRGERDLNHWYNKNGAGFSMAVQHVENDIKDGYHPRLAK